MKQAYIYGLMEPGTGTIRYVGKTYNMIRRLKGHMESARSKSNTHRANWLRFLGRVPDVCLLQVCRENEWQEAERFWIDTLRNTGHDLVNSTLGGDGINEAGRPLPEKNRLALVRAWADPEKRKARCMAMSRGAIGKVLTEQHKNNIRLGVTRAWAAKRGELDA